MEMINTIDKNHEAKLFKQFVAASDNRFASKLNKYNLYDKVYINTNTTVNYIIVGRYYTQNGKYKNYTYRLKEEGANRRISSITIHKWR